MSGIRRAAAALYGLHHEDREAILAQLSVHEQEQLGEALAELEGLGFARNIDAALREDEPVLHDTGAPARLHDDHLTVVEDTAQRTVIADEAQLTRVLTRAQPNQIGVILSREPAVLIAEVLHIAVWPWADTFLTSLPQPLRLEVRAVLFNTRPAAPGRRLWLLRTLAERVAMVPAATTCAVTTLPISKRLRWLPWRA